MIGSAAGALAAQPSCVQASRPAERRRKSRRDSGEFMRASETIRRRMKSADRARLPKNVRKLGCRSLLAGVERIRRCTRREQARSYINPPSLPQPPQQREILACFGRTGIEFEHAFEFADRLGTLAVIGIHDAQIEMA